MTPPVKVASWPSRAASACGVPKVRVMIQPVSSSEARSAVAAAPRMSTKARAALPIPVSPWTMAEPSCVIAVLITWTISSTAATTAAISRDRP